MGKVHVTIDGIQVYVPDTYTVLEAAKEINIHIPTLCFLKDVSEIGCCRMCLVEVKGSRALQAACGYPVRGMSYPFGAYSEHVIELARSCGMEYSRTVEATGRFDLPEDFMKWHPTAHHNGDLKGLWKQFKERDFDQMLLFYVWGHSFEFDGADNWEVMEEFCKMAADQEDVWYATNIQIKDYVTAARSLVFSTDMHMVYNPSALDVWISVDGEPVCIRAGKLWKR